MPASARLLTIVTWERFQGGGAGNRSPMPAPGRATALARWRTGTRGPADPATGPGPGGRLTPTGAPLSPGGPRTARPARTVRRGSLARAAGPVTAGRTQACPEAGPP